MSNRAHLKWLVRRIADEACKRIDDPKNVSKGDGWCEMEWAELHGLADEEDYELMEATEGGAGDPISEAGDGLVVDAMRVDKAKVFDHQDPEEIARKTVKRARRELFSERKTEGPAPSPEEVRARRASRPTSGKES